MRFTLEELEALPTLSVGQADSLKIEDEDMGVRVWLSRCTVEDGEPFDHKVSIERRAADGRWRTVEVFEGKPGNGYFLGCGPYATVQEEKEERA
jgi:hypothetical protein